MELGEHGDQMVKNVCLDAFVVIPVGVVGEAIDLHGEALFGGLEVAHKEGHARMMDFGVGLEIGLAVGTECAQVREAAAIGKRGKVFGHQNFLIEFVNFSEAAFQVGTQKFNL
jgi:hypothetical protein